MAHAVTTSLQFERHAREDHDGRGSEGEQIPVLVVAGDLDAATAGDFAAAAGSVIALEHPTRMVVDLAGVDFIDSTGLNELVRAHRALHRSGGRLVLRSPGDTVRVLLDITRLTGHLDIE
jgi:anti-sigma B factor antagonist